MGFDLLQKFLDLPLQSIMSIRIEKEVFWYLQGPLNFHQDGGVGYSNKLQRMAEGADPGCLLI
jgi:hypothetical protein